MSRLCLTVCLILPGLATPTQGRGDPARTEAPVQTLRYLRIRNYTNEVLTVYLRYSTKATGELEPTLKFTVQPNSDLFLEKANGKQGKTPIMVHRFRVWAESPTARWTEYRDKDLLLTTYRARCVRTTTYPFAPP